MNCLLLLKECLFVVSSLNTFGNCKQGLVARQLKHLQKILTDTYRKLSSNEKCIAPISLRGGIRATRKNLQEKRVFQNQNGYGDWFDSRIKGFTAIQ